MRAPPAAVWRFRDDRLWRALHALLFSVTAAALVAWSLQWLLRWAPGGLDGVDGLGGEALSFRLMAALTLGSAFAFGLLGWRWGRQPAGQVLWTGEGWRWQPDAMPESACDVEVRAMLDAGYWLLLRLHRLESCGGRDTGAQAPSWLSARGPRGLVGVPSPGQHMQWIAFRAAVYFAASRPGRLLPTDSLAT